MLSTENFTFALSSTHFSHTICLALFAWKCVCSQHESYSYTHTYPSECRLHPCILNTKLLYIDTLFHILPSTLFIIPLEELSTSPEINYLLKLIYRCQKKSSKECLRIKYKLQASHLQLDQSLGLLAQSTRC